MKSKLKPCPFCGGAAKPYCLMHGYVQIICRYCLASSFKSTDVEKTSRWWNERIDQTDTKRKGEK